MTSLIIDRIDGLSSAAAIKGPCRVATTANITLYGEQTIDGVAVVTGDRVLVKDQTAGYECGIYICDTGQWRRSKDFNKTRDVVKGTAVFVTDGTANAETLWSVTSANPVDVGTDAVAFSSGIIVPPDGSVGPDQLTNASDIRNFLDTAPYVATRTALKALDTAKDVVAILMESGREGIFNWKTGDYSTEIAADTLEGVYVKATAIAASSGAWVREYVGKPALPWFGADKTGVSDASGSLASAVGIYPHLIIPEGEYLIDQDVTIPAGVVVEFDNGAVLNIGTGVTLTWNGGIIAGPYQRIFSGDLVQSAYTTNSLTPYVLALQGKPKIEYASPWWFGAVGDGKQADDGAITSGDATFTSASAAFTSADIGKYIVVNGAGAAGVPLPTTILSINSSTSVDLAVNASTTVSGASYTFGTDDYDAFICAIFFGKVAYVPGIDAAAGNRYLCSTSIPVRQSGSVIRGDGYASWCVLASIVPTGVGQFFGVAGLLPTISGGLPAAFVEDVVFDGIHVDTNKGTNDNGIGGSFCKNTVVRNCHFSNVGRKAVTWQYHVHNNQGVNCIIHSAAMESAGLTQSAFSTEGENASFTYSNGVPAVDWNGDDNTGNDFYNIHIVQSGGSGVVVSNAKRCEVSGITMDTIGGRPLVTARYCEDVVFRGVYAKLSTIGFINAGSANSISVKFEDCWIDDCSGDEMFYSEGPGVQFINSGGTQTDDRIAWSIRGADCKIINCRLNATAFTSATAATALFSTATRFSMTGSYVDSAAALRGLGTSTADHILIANNHFTGGITDGVKIGGDFCRVVNNLIGGDGAGRVRIDSGAQYFVVTGNPYTGVSPATTIATTSDLFGTGVCANNPGDVGGIQCERLGAVIIASGPNTPEAAIVAAIGSTFRRTNGGAGTTFYVKESGAGNTGWIGK